MIDTGLEGKVVLVTGANNPEGIGAATARAFASQGAAVMIHYYSQPFDKSSVDEAQLEMPGFAHYYAAQARSGADIAAEIRSQGGRAEACDGDLADPALAPRLLDQAENSFGRVDVLVNNAACWAADTFIPIPADNEEQRGFGGFGPPKMTLTAESHDRQFAVNCRAAAMLMTEYAKRLLSRQQRWGRVINISTDAAAGHPEEISYWASKHALESYSRAAARELGPYGITVNIVSPGPTQTGWLFPELEKSLIPQIPLRRVGRPEDIADAIVFLASEQARWVTGQLLYVGGGHRMSM